MLELCSTLAHYAAVGSITHYTVNPFLASVRPAHVFNLALYNAEVIIGHLIF